VVLLFLFSICSGVVYAESIKGPSLPYADTSVEHPTREVDQDAFEPGEKLKLRVTYLGLTAGYITVNVDREIIEGRDLYTLNMHARTAGPAAWFYTASDELISYMDAEGLFSWGYDFYKNHQNERENTRVRYHHGKGFFSENGAREGEIPPYTQDLLSAVYFIRTQNLEVGQTYQFPVHSSDRYYRLTIDVAKEERVATKDGWRDSFQLVPTLERSTDRDEAFDHVKSVQGVKLWISQDKHKVPLKISLPATFGHLYGYLQSYQPG
jgi:hypothetical protein